MRLKLWAPVVLLLIIVALIPSARCQQSEEVASLDSQGLIEPGETHEGPVEVNADQAQVAESTPAIPESDLELYEMKPTQPLPEPTPQSPESQEKPPEIVTAETPNSAQQQVPEQISFPEPNPGQPEPADPQPESSVPPPEPAPAPQAPEPSEQPPEPIVQPSEPIVQPSEPIVQPSEPTLSPAEPTTPAPAATPQQQEIQQPAAPTPVLPPPSPEPEPSPPEQPVQLPEQSVPPPPPEQAAPEPAPKEAESPQQPVESTPAPPPAAPQVPTPSSPQAELTSPPPAESVAQPAESAHQKPELTSNSISDTPDSPVKSTKTAVELTAPPAAALIAAGAIPELTGQSAPSVCGANSLPEPIVNMTVDRIIGLISGANCSEAAGLKLEPLSNKQIFGRVMETSSMPVELTQLLAPSRVSVANCSHLETKREGKLEQIRLRLSLVLEMSNLKLRSRWRLYPRFRHEEAAPADALHPRARGSYLSDQATRLVGKCQKFKVEGGDYYLELLSPSLSMDFEVTLSKLSEKAYAVERKLGGAIELLGLKVNELYLDHGLRVREQPAANQSKVKLSARSYAPAKANAAVVQIVHDRNNYQRRNDWLLNLFANWLRHEYRGQLVELLGRPLVSRINSCLRAE